VSLGQRIILRPDNAQPAAHYMNERVFLSIFVRAFRVFAQSRLSGFGRKLKINVMGDISNIGNNLVIFNMGLGCV
jgi:hypothetical protein